MCSINKIFKFKPKKYNAGSSKEFQKTNEFQKNITMFQAVKHKSLKESDG